MQKLDITIRRGETVAIPVRIESATLTYKAITAISKAGPVRLTVTGHGCPDGWRAAVANAGGMTQINFPRSEEGKPPKDKDLHAVSVIDANTIEFNGINAAAFSTYTSGGQLVYFEPFDLAGYTEARMKVRNRPGGTELASFSTTDGTLALDADNSAVWLQLTAEQSAALDFDAGVFDIEIVDGAGQVTALCAANSTLSVSAEITTP